MLDWSGPRDKQTILFDEIPAQQQVSAKRVAAYVYDKLLEASTLPGDVYGAAANDMYGFIIKGVRLDMNWLSLRFSFSG
jgi:hypothetical protein